MDHLGDVIVTTPLIRALAMAGNTVEVIVPKAFAPVFTHSPRVKAAHAMEDICPQFPNGWRALSDWIRAQKFDVILLPYARQRELLWASFFSGTRTRVAMWAGVWGRLTLHQCLSSRLLDEPRYFGDVVLDCARALGIPPQGAQPELFLSDDEIATAGKSLRQRFGTRALVGIHPGCAGNACNLPSQVYAQVAQSLLEQGDCALIITGGAKERELLKTWPQEILSSSHVWNSMGEISLRQLAVTIRHMTAYVCPSTGPLHIASALDIPTVSPFCSIDNLSPKVWGNQRPNATTLTPGIGFCREQRKFSAVHCDFCGKIPAANIVEKVLGCLP
ncbi:MAG TPA: glycosyltransferase family 9 protein [Verrucomicrobiae bacterium]